MDVYVYANSKGFAPCCAHGEVCHFRSYAGQADEAFNGVGDVAVPFVAQYLSGLLDVFCFEVVEADFVYEGVQSGGFEGDDGFEIEALMQS
jgi:hypothetical protein